jgi:DNA-directed RNA polymerase subunit L
MDDRILASCTVDELGNMQHEVKVWGEKPFDHKRIYTIKAKDDNSAAQEGLRLFVEEMENLRDAVTEEK